MRVADAVCGHLLRAARRGAGGAADDVVAVEGGFEGDGGEEVFAELGADGAEFIEC